MIRVVFLTRYLDRGGAEKQLAELLRGLDKSRFNVTLVTFYPGGPLLPDITSIEGLTLVCAGKGGRWDFLGFAWRLLRIISERHPHIVHGYMPTSNVLSLLTGKLCRAKVVWGIRASNMDLTQYEWMAAPVFRIAVLLSRFPDCIIVNSIAGRRHHVASGYPAERTIVVHNGIDTERFRPAAAARQRIRAEWGVGDSEFLIGMVARIDPMKGHETFLHAAAQLAQTRRDVRFVCVGGGEGSDYFHRLMHLAQWLGLEDRVLWSGARADMPDVYNALDVAVSSSHFGEGFSNAIGEAMASGVPCVVTDVGDSALIVGETGFVTEPKDANSLVAGLQHMLAAITGDRNAVAQACRSRIVTHFSVPRMVSGVEAILEGLVR